MSNRKCCVPGCVNSKAEVTATLHKFPNPVKYKELFNSWLCAIGGEILKFENAHIFKNRRVCQIHFEPKYWCRNSRVSVNALPTKHMPGFKDEKNKDAPPCKKIKRVEKPPKQLTEPVEPNLPEEVTKVEENVPDSDLRSPSPHSDVPDPEPEPGPFSWQKPLPVCVEKDDILSDKEVPVAELDVENEPKNLNEATEAPSKYTIKNKEGEDEKYVSEKHSEFSCDHCLGEIIGYTCVQCDNFDLCRACETQLVHPYHYMLRVPKPRPFNEIRSVIASIRIKLKLLEEAFQQNSGDWADVVIKKEEDPLEGEDTTVTQPATAEDPLEESVVPNTDINESQEANKQDSKSTSKDIQKKTSHLSQSTSITESSVQKSTVVFKKRVVLSGILDKDVIFVKNDVVPKANLVFTQRKDAVLNTNVKLIKQDTVIPNLDLRLEESKNSNKNEKLVKQNTSPNLIFLQQKQIIPKTDAVKFQLQKDRTSNINKTSLQDTAVKTDINLQQTVSESNVLEANNADTNRDEMIEEYLDDVWLDESILGEDNGHKDKTIEAEQSKTIIADEKNQIDKVKEFEEREETKEKTLESKENINKRTKEKVKEGKILNYKIKEAETSHGDVIQHSNMLPIAETDDVTVVRMNVNQSNVENPYNYYYYQLLPKNDKHK